MSRRPVMRAADVMRDIKCPICGLDATYRYGKTPEGQQKYICLSCGKQFIEAAANRKAIERPFCPSCLAPMYLYMQSTDFKRFRCSRYPECRTYKKVFNDTADKHDRKTGKPGQR